jgi:ornithine racemase
VFRLYAEIIELIEKPLLPDGEMGKNVEGASFEFDDTLIGKTSCRAIIDLGLLDADEKHMKAIDAVEGFVGASSDMIVIDLGNNEKNYKVGDLLEFSLDYMGALRILNSRYIGKYIINNDTGDRS